MTSYPAPEFDVELAPDTPVPTRVMGGALDVRIYVAGQNWQGGMLILPSLDQKGHQASYIGWLWCNHPERVLIGSALPRITVVDLLPDPMTGGSWEESSTAKSLRFDVVKIVRLGEEERP